MKRITSNIWTATQAAAAILERYRPKYQALVALRREITALETGEQERLQRIDMLTFHKEEIEQAALKPDEDEALAQRKAYFDHAGKIGGRTRAGAYGALGR